jgi:hypothetical protein
MTPDWSTKPQGVPYATLNDPQSLNLYTYVRNNPLNRIDPNGHYEVNASKCKGRTQVKCQKQYNEAVTNFENALEKDLKSKDPRVRAGAEAYGGKGEQNGVHVGFESNKQLTQEYGKPIDGRVSVDLNANGKNKPIDIQVTISSDLSGSHLEREVAHEGIHVADDSKFLTSYDFGTGKYDSSLNITHLATETSAYSAGAVIEQNFGFGPNNTQKIQTFIKANYPNYNDKQFPSNADFPQ